MTSEREPDPFTSVADGLLPTDNRPDAFAGTTHHVACGPITRSVADAALLMEVMAGIHPRDPSSVPVDIKYERAVDRPVDDVQVAYSRDLDTFPVADEIAGITRETSFDALGAAGATFESVSVDHGLSIEEFVSTLKTTTGVSTAHGSEVLEQTI